VGVQELDLSLVVHPPRWFICLLGSLSFHFVPCFSLFWVLWLIYGWQGFIIIQFNELGVGEAPKEANHLTITLVTSPTFHVSLLSMAHNILSQVSLAEREIRMCHIGMLKPRFNGITLYTPIPCLLL